MYVRKMIINATTFTQINGKKEEELYCCLFNLDFRSYFIKFIKVLPYVNCLMNRFALIFFSLGNLRLRGLENTFHVITLLSCFFYINIFEN